MSKEPDMSITYSLRRRDNKLLNYNVRMLTQKNPTKISFHFGVRPCADIHKKKHTDTQVVAKISENFVAK